MKANAYTLMRLGDAPDLAALKRVWDSLSDTQRMDREIEGYKEFYKAQFEKEAK